MHIEISPSDIDIGYNVQ